MYDFPGVFVLLLPDASLRDFDSVGIYLKWETERTLLLSTQKDVHVIGQCVPGVLLQGEPGSFLDLKSIIVHLNNLAWVSTVVGMICLN